MPKGHIHIAGYKLFHVYEYLFFSLVALLLVYPLLNQVLFWQTLFLFFILFTLVASIMATSTQWRQLIIMIPIACLTFFANWFANILPYEWLPIVSMLSGIIFFMYVIVVMLQDIFIRHLQITAEMIYGAVSVYLLMGLLFAFIYGLIYLLSPEAFNYSSGEVGYYLEDLEAFIYYSFVTLTTLGYGDITPKIPAAMATAYMQAVMGQIYLTVMVARIVGLYITQKQAP